MNEVFGGTLKEILGPLVLLLLRQGLPTTLQLSLIALCLAVGLGFFLGLIRFERVFGLKSVIGVYVDLMRGLPFLMVLFIVYHLVPLFVPFRMTEMLAAICALLAHEAAYFTEIVRGSLTAIPKSQTEASKALGFNYFQRMLYIILPQAVRLALPPAAGETVLLIKNTSVVSIIGLMELTRIGRVQMQTNLRPFLTFALVGAFYFAICYPLLHLSGWLEDRVAKKVATSS
jgi:polar amino acid transport system permease protein